MDRIRQPKGRPERGDKSHLAEIGSQTFEEVSKSLGLQALQGSQGTVVSESSRISETPLSKAA